MTRVPSPTVSVVIPAYNSAWCVDQAIDSVLAQTYRDYEIIVVDDGSTDTTRDVVQRYGNAVRLISKPNGGMSSARNRGISEARGRYIAFLDSDDRWLPTKLACQVELLETHPDVVFCAAVATLEDPEGTRLGEWGCCRSAEADLENVFANHSAVAGGASAVLARTEAVCAEHGFDESLGGAEDTDLWIRLAARGRYVCIDEPLLIVLRRPGSVSRNLDAMRTGSLAMTRKNRALLPADKRGSFWRSVYAGILCDYAKWEYREGRTLHAVRHLGEVLLIAPVTRGRLAVSLLAAIALRQRV